MDTEKASTTLRDRLVGYATEDKIPEGWKVTLLVGGCMLSGICVAVREFVEATTKGMEMSLREKEPKLAAAFGAVDVSDLAHDASGPFVYLRCDAIIANGVTTQVGGAIFRIRRSAIDGLALSGTGVEP